MPHLGEILSSKNEQRKHSVCTSSPLFFPLCFCSPRIPADLPLLQNLFSFFLFPLSPYSFCLLQQVILGSLLHVPSGRPISTCSMQLPPQEARSPTLSRHRHLVWVFPKWREKILMNKTNIIYVGGKRRKKDQKRRSTNMPLFGRAHECKRYEH